eukprot:541649-Heterocapsa_arctica.AAC.1
MILILIDRGPCGVTAQGRQYCHALRPIAAEKDSSRFVKVSTDGGAVHLADPRLRRAGWGMWVSEGHPLNCYGVVPGIEQTAGRAELFAAVRVLERTSGD